MLYNVLRFIINNYKNARMTNNDKRMTRKEAEADYFLITRASCFCSG